MFTRSVIAAMFGLAFVLPAAAAPSNSTQSGTQPNAMNGQQNTQQSAPAAISSRLRQSLSQAGFTDVHVMPESFLVRAKDKDGNPVMMVVNPDSVTSVTAVGRSNKEMGSTGPGSSGNNSASAGNNGTTKE